MTSYQPVILAEFVAAILLVAVTPFATSKNKQGLSPYAGKDITQLVAIAAVYLILSLMSVGGRGTARFAAWFGALILLAVGLGEAAALVKLFSVTGLAQGAEGGTAGAAGAAAAGGL